MPAARRVLSFEEPRIMAILNITEDSFYQGSRYNLDQIEKTVDQMLNDGADLLDIGAMSSRPGAQEISEQKEIDRLLPAVEFIRRTWPNVIISIDTYRSEVVRACTYIGVDMVNDITTGLKDEKLLHTIAQAKLPYIMMHMKGSPPDMQDQPEYEDLILDIIGFFRDRLSVVREVGIKDIMVDPGIGFGKSADDNFKIIRQLRSFELFDLPLLVGLSRKSLIYNTLKTKPDQALNGTTALHMVALMNGANMLRVHDVQAAVECKKLFQKITTTSENPM
jgi:dihydropteroate synthase